MDEPLAPDAAKRLIREILRAGRFTYSRHAKEELLADGLTTVDCELILHGICSLCLSAMEEANGDHREG